MADLFFLPSWPVDTRPFPWFVLLLFAAVLVGEAVQRLLRMPRLIGWIAAGIAVGPAATGLLDAAAIARLSWLVDIAMGLVLFELGQRVDLKWLTRNPWLLATSVAESAFGFAAMFGVLLLTGAPPLLAAVAAAIGIATSPAVTLTLARDLRAQGQVTERMLLFTTLNCIYAVIAVAMLFAWLHAEYRGGWLAVLVHPIYLIFGSLALAALLAMVALRVLRALRRRADAQYICMIAMAVLAVSVAEAFKLSVVLSLLAFGALTRVFDAGRHFASLDFGRIGQICVIFLFALTAAGIDLALLPAGLFAGVALAAARCAGKALPLFALARPSGLGLRKASLVTLALMPMSAMALILMRDTSNAYPEFGPALATVMLSAIAVLELAGPLLAQFALIRAGEVAEGNAAGGETSASTAQYAAAGAWRR